MLLIMISFKVAASCINVVIPEINNSVGVEIPVTGK